MSGNYSLYNDPTQNYEKENIIIAPVHTNNFIIYGAAFTIFILIIFTAIMILLYEIVIPYTSLPRYSYAGVKTTVT